MESSQLLVKCSENKNAFGSHGVKLMKNRLRNTEPLLTPPFPDRLKMMLVPYAADDPTI